MKWSLGFGLERLGLAVLRAPRVATTFLLLSIIASIALVPNLKFDGNLTSAVDQNSAAYKQYEARRADFAETANAIAIAVSGENLLEPAVFEGVRTLQLDLTLEPDITSIFSVFSLSDAIGALKDDAEATLPYDFTEAGATPPAQALDAFIAAEPSAAALASTAEPALLLLVEIDGLTDLGHAALDARLGEFSKLIEQLGPDGVTYAYAGRYHLRTGITNAIIADQALLTGLAIALGAGVAWLIFATWRAALVCTLAPGVAVLWTLALFSATGTPIDFLTTALPTLALIITFADTVVLYFKWQTLDAADSTDRVGNLKEALRTVGPASALTSVTTALAFASFSISTSAAMDRFALFGVLCVVFAFLSLMVAMPLATWWTLQFASKKRSSGKPRVGTEGPRLALWVTSAPRLTVLVAVCLVIAFGWVSTRLEPSYAARDYLPVGSDIRNAEAFVDRVFGGTSQVYATLPTVDGPFSTETAERLQAVQDAVAATYGAGRTVSLASAGGDPAVLEEALEQVSPGLRNRFISLDGSKVQVTAGASASENTALAAERLDDLRTRLDVLPYGDDVSVTGLTVLLAIELPKMIGELRFSLLASVLIVIIVVAVATRSIPLAIACVLPNILPVLFTQTVIWSMGASLSLTNVVALTIGFGIAIDNSIHVINAFRAMQGHRATVVGDVRAALSEVAPALFSGTAIICIAASITLLSTMPSIAELGGLLIATLLVALISNIAILPSAMIVMLRATGGVREK